MKEAPVKIPMYDSKSPMAKSWREWFSDLYIATKSVRFPARNNDPVVTNGTSVIWQSDGTGSGDDGDIMLTIRDTSGTEKTTTLVDFSTL